MSRGTASLLQVLAAAAGASHAVEVGTGTGVSGAAILAGLRERGVLTTIDLEAGAQQVARDTFHALGIPHTGYRLIAGAAEDVLTRLSDGAYDLMFIDTPPATHRALVEQAARLLRPGGILAITCEVEASRDLLEALAGDFVRSLVPLGAGLVVAARAEEATASE